MTTQKAGTPEEQFVASINAMETECENFRKALDEAQRRLGSDVADRPAADHSGTIATVKIIEAKYAGAAQMLRIAIGYRTGMFIAAPQNQS